MRYRRFSNCVSWKNPSLDLNLSKIIRIQRSYFILSWKSPSNLGLSTHSLIFCGSSSLHFSRRFTQSDESGEGTHDLNELTSLLEDYEFMTEKSEEIVPSSGGFVTSNTDDGVGDLLGKTSDQLYEEEDNDVSENAEFAVEVEELNTSGNVFEEDGLVHSTVEENAEEGTEVSPEGKETISKTRKYKKGGKHYKKPEAWFSPPPKSWLEKTFFDENCGESISLESLLFNITTSHNDPIHYVDSVGKVLREMKLFSNPMKELIFIRTDWLSKVEAYEKRTASSLIEDCLVGKSETPEENDRNMSATVENACKGSNLSGQESLPPVKNDQEPRPEELQDSKSGPVLPISQDTLMINNNNPPIASIPAPATHMEMIGRPKLMRYLLHQYLKHQILWFDNLSELLEEATKEVLHHHFSSTSTIAVTADLSFQWPISGMFCAEKLNDIIFLSHALVDRLLQILVDDEYENNQSNTEPPSASSSSSPKHLWETFILNHCQDVFLSSPQKGPFSFGEIRPSFTRNDTDLFHYLRTSDNVYEKDEKATKLESVLGKFSEREWNALSDWQKNSILFGPMSAHVASLAIRDPSGLYAVYHNEKADGSNLISENSSALPAEEEKERSVDEDRDVQDEQSEETAFHERHRRAEYNRMVQYNVDRFYMGIVEPTVVEDRSGADISVLPNKQKKCVRLPLPELIQEVEKTAKGKRKKIKGLTARTEYFTGGFFMNPTSGECEDAQLSDLYKKFQEMESSTLLDEYMQSTLRRKRRKREIVVDIMHQLGFLLLFFSLPEVRTITSPENTYYRLSFLHKKLRQTIYIALCIHEKIDFDVSFYEKEFCNSAAHLRKFENLSPIAQISYACFGGSYLGGATPKGGRKNTIAPTGVTNSTPRACADGGALYEDLLQMYPTQLVYRKGMGNLPKFSDLVPLQQFALSFCFSQTPMESAECRLLLTSNENEIALESHSNSEAQRACGRVVIQIPLTAAELAPEISKKDKKVLKRITNKLLKMQGKSKPKKDGEVHRMVKRSKRPKGMVSSGGNGEEELVSDEAEEIFEKESLASTKTKKKETVKAAGKTKTAESGDLVSDDEDEGGRIQSIVEAILDKRSMKQTKGKQMHARKNEIKVHVNQKPLKKKTDKYSSARKNGRTLKARKNATKDNLNNEKAFPKRRVGRPRKDNLPLTLLDEQTPTRNTKTTRKETSQLDDLNENADLLLAFMEFLQKFNKSKGNKFKTKKTTATTAKRTRGKKPHSKSAKHVEKKAHVAKKTGKKGRKNDNGDDIVSG